MNEENCSVCGSAIGSGDSFCVNCGAARASARPASPPPPPAMPLPVSPPAPPAPSVASPPAAALAQNYVATGYTGASPYGTQPHVAPGAPAAYGAFTPSAAPGATDDLWRIAIGMAAAGGVLAMFGLIGFNLMLAGVAIVAIVLGASPAAAGRSFSATYLTTGVSCIVFGVFGILTGTVDEIAYRFGTWPSSLITEGLDDFTVIDTLNTVTGAISLVAGVVVLIVSASRQPAR